MCTIRIPCKGLSGFNRTIVELKSTNLCLNIAETDCFNRTIVELKFLLTFLKMI